MRRMPMAVMAAWCVTTICGGGWALAGEEGWKAPAAEQAARNPVPRKAAMRAGKKTFELNCIPCHGPAGRGDGPAAAAMTPKPKNLIAGYVQEQTDGELFWKITTGRGSMPSWRQLPEKERWSLIHYIRSLARAKTQ